MTSRDRFEGQLDELERLVIQTVRKSKSRDLPNESATLEAIHKRVAALPLTGMPNIEIPDVPVTGPTTLISGANAPAAMAAKGAAATLPLPSIPMTAWFTWGQVKLAATAIAIAGSAAIGTGLISVERTVQDSTATEDIPAEVGEARAKPRLSREKAAGIDAKNTAQQVALRTDVRRAALVSPRSENSTRSPAAATVLSTPVSDGAADLSFEKQQVPTLTGELEQLRHAQQALQRGEPSRALQTMLALDREASAGPLYPERQIIKVLALCAMGRNAEAESLAQRLNASSGGAVYAARLRNSCVSRSTTIDQ